MLIGCGYSHASSAADHTELELRVKAAFIYNFARYSQWPEQQNSDVFRLCLAGDKKLLPVLQQTVIGKTVDQRTIEVRLSVNDGDVQTCEVLYLGEQASEELRTRSMNSSAPVLLVGEGKDFTLHGGMVGFYLDQGRLRFAINPRRVRHAGINMSSQLLGLATITGGP